MNLKNITARLDKICQDLDVLLDGKVVSGDPRTWKIFQKIDTDRLTYELSDEIDDGNEYDLGGFDVLMRSKNGQAALVNSKELVAEFLPGEFDVWKKPKKDENGTITGIPIFPSFQTYITESDIEPIGGMIDLLELQGGDLSRFNNKSRLQSNFREILDWYKNI